MSTYRLDKLLMPRSIALVGASPRPRSVGRTILQNLRAAGFDGPIGLVNPKYPEIEGIRAVADVARLACVNVMPTALIGIDENVDAAGENIHVQRLAELRGWAQPLQLPRGKVSYHLLASRNVAAAILDFARSNHVHHIVMGAPALGSYAGRVVAQVTAEAPCGVTVVRATGETDPRPQH